MPQLNLDAQLCEALTRFRDDRYKVLLGRVFKDCVEQLLAGDKTAATDALKTLNLPLSAAERLPPTFDGLEAATWVRTAVHFLEAVSEAARAKPKCRDNHLLDIDRRVLTILRGSKAQPMRRAEIWKLIEMPVTQAQVGQALLRCEARKWVDRLIGYGPLGASYRIRKCGLERLACLGI